MTDIRCKNCLCCDVDRKICCFGPPILRENKVTGEMEAVRPPVDPERDWCISRFVPRERAGQVVQAVINPTPIIGGSGVPR